MGRKTQRRGKSLEDQLKELHTAYEQAGMALVHKAPTGVRILKGLGKGRFEVVLHKAWPDYIACLTALGGRYACFDAKLTSQPRYSHPKERMHQCHTLWKIHQAGGIAFILCVWEGDTYLERKGFVLWPQPYWDTSFEKGWSMPLFDAPSETVAEPIPQWQGDMFYLPDWLALLERRF